MKIIENYNLDELASVAERADALLKIEDATGGYTGGYLNVSGFNLSTSIHSCLDMLEYLQDASPYMDKERMKNRLDKNLSAAKTEYEKLRDVIDKWSSACKIVSSIISDMENLLS